MKGEERKKKGQERKKSERIAVDLLRPALAHPHLLCYPGVIGDAQQSTVATALQDLSRAGTALTRMQRSKVEALAKLEEAGGISTKLSSLGTHRDTVMLHALNGLANTKTLYASGAPLSHEVRWC